MDKNQKIEMNSKKNKLIAIALIIIIVDIIGVIVLMIVNFNNKNNNDATENNTTSNNTNINNPDKDNPKDEDISDNNDNDKLGDEESRTELYIYKHKDSITNFYYIKSIGDEESLNKIKEMDSNNFFKDFELKKLYKCSYDNCEFMSGYNNNVMIYDGKVYLYNMLDDSIKKIYITIDEHSKQYLNSIDATKCGGYAKNFNLIDNVIAYKNISEDKYSIYNIGNEQVISNQIYDEVCIHSFAYPLSSKYFSFAEKGLFVGIKYGEQEKDIQEYNILDSMTGDIKHTFSDYTYGLGDDLNYYYATSNFTEFYTSNFEKIATGSDVLSPTIYNGNLVIGNVGNKSYSIYSDSNLIYKSKEYDKILDFVDGYFIAIEGGKLHVISLDETTNILICDWLEEYIYPGVAFFYDDTIELGYWLDKEGNEGVTYKYNFKTNKLEYKNEPMQWTI